jgi:ankyrin repeat protein
MLDWVASAVACVGGAAFCFRCWYRWQGRQEAGLVVRAIETRDVAELAALLAGRVDLRLVGEHYGEPALIRAVGCPAAVELLLAAGAAVDERGPGWMTALMRAAAAGDEATCRLLLARGADPNAADLFGRTASWWAAQAGHPCLERLLRTAAV